MKNASESEMTERPCKYCVANWAGMTTRHGGSAILPEPQDCEMAHRDDPRIYDLARVFARVFQGTKEPSDEQVAWFLGDADDVVDDFKPAPERWRVRKLPASENDGFDGIDQRVRINDVTYVALEGGKDSRGSVVRLSEFRSWTS